MSDDEAPDAEDKREFPVRGPATAQQAMVAIAVLCLVCLVIGFVLGRTL